MNSQEISGPVYDRESSHLWKAFGGALFLFVVNFILINVLLVDSFIYFVRGSWRPPLRDIPGSTVFVSWWMILLPWMVISRSYSKWGKANRIFHPKTRLEKRSLIVLVVMGVVFLVFFFAIPHCNVLVETLRFHILLWGRLYGIMNTLLLYVYYVLEAMFVVWIADGFQTAGALLTKRIRIPWGGIGLALTWGAMHIYTKGFAMGWRAMAYGLFMGVLYEVSRKSVWPPVLAWLMNYLF